MSLCSLSIVECLRVQGIEPIASASSEYSGSYLAKNALNYETNNYFATKRLHTQQYLDIDFTEVISLKSYKIKTVDDDSFIRKWIISTSLDKIKWNVASKEGNGFPGDTEYPLIKTFNARYARLNASCLASDDPTFFQIYHIKFFGSLTPNYNNNNRNSCNRRKIIDYNLMRMILILSS